MSSVEFDISRNLAKIGQVAVEKASLDRLRASIIAEIKRLDAGREVAVGDVVTSLIEDGYLGARGTVVRVDPVGQVLPWPFFVCYGETKDDFGYYNRDEIVLLDKKGSNA